MRCERCPPNGACFACHRRERAQQGKDPIGQQQSGHPLSRKTARIMSGAEMLRDPTINWIRRYPRDA